MFNFGLFKMHNICLVNHTFNHTIYLPVFYACKKQLFQWIQSCMHYKFETSLILMSNFLDENLDLENFGKKKKKKKKTFNLEELDGALPENATNKSKEDGIEEMDEENAIEVTLHLSYSKLLI